MNVNLILLKKSGEKKSIDLPGSVTVIGRGRDCDLRIPLPSVPKRHCQLSSDQGVLKLRDLGSRNGTKLNGKDVKEAIINPGDSMEIGPVKVLFQIDGKPAGIDKSSIPDNITETDPELSGLDLMDDMADSSVIDEIAEPAAIDSDDESDDLDMLDAEPGSFTEDDLDSLLEDIGASDESESNEGSFLDDMSM